MFGKAATRFVGRNFNPNLDDNWFFSRKPIGNGRFNVNANRHPSNSGKSISKEPIDRVSSRHSSRCAGRFIMNLYDKLCSYDNLFLAFRKARKNKTARWYVKEFEKDLERNLMILENELRTIKYNPSRMKTFVIHNPKTRVINASHFRDRVVHHAVCNVIEPIFEKSFIYDSYASRKGKGTHAAIKRFDIFKRQVSRNGLPVRNAKDNNMVVGFVLKADIRHYFDTVNHEILLAILRKKIDDEKVIWLVKTILNNHKTKEQGKGMPIGNLTSQFFANVYLNELDYFVKHELRTKFYIRYLDDFVILHNDRSKLDEWKEQINEFLCTQLKLELHPEKSKIYPLYRGITFLGFRIFYYYKLLKKSNIKSIHKRLDKFKQEYRGRFISHEEVESRMEGWFAYAVRGNTHKLCRKLKKKLKLTNL